MTQVAILPVSAEHGDVAYRAVAGEKQSYGRTVGEALDALTAQLPEEEIGTLVIVQYCRPDHFFGAAEQQRLAELMDAWRRARDLGSAFPPGDQAELEALVEAELRASTDRTAALADTLRT